MAKAKEGDLFSCVECGLIVVVDQGSGYGAAGIICCEQPMAKGKLAANKARKKAPALTASKKVEAKKATKAAVKTKTKATAKTKAKAVAKPKAKATAKPKAPAAAVKKVVKKAQARTKKA